VVGQFDLSKIRAKFESMSVADFAQLLAGGVIVTYICGFIIVTSYLGRLGIRDYDAFKFQYLVAGVIAILIFGTYFWFARLRPLHIDEEVSLIRSWQESHGASNWLARAISVAHPFIDIIYRLTICTLAISSLLLFFPQDTKPFVVVPALFVPGLVEGLYGPKLMERGAVGAFRDLFFGKVIAIAGFFLIAPPHYLKIFIFYLALAFAFLNLAVALKTTISKPALIAYAALSSFVLCSSFIGSTLYGHMRPWIGGGTPLPVKLVMTNLEAADEINRVIDVRGGVSNQVDLIAETSSEFVIGTGWDGDRYSNVIRLRRDLVKAVQFEQFGLSEPVRTSHEPPRPSESGAPSK